MTQAGFGYLLQHGGNYTLNETAPCSICTNELAGDMAWQVVHEL